MGEPQICCRLLDKYMYNCGMFRITLKKISALTTFFALSLALAPALTLAENLRSTIVLNTANDTPNSTPNLTGICDRVLTEAFKRIGVPVRIIRLPSERALINANEGIDDGDFARIEGMNKIYSNLIRVPESITKFEFVAFTKRLNFRINGWDSLKPYNVGIVTGWKILEANLAGAKSVIKVKNSNILFNLLNTEKVDIIVYDRMQGKALLNELKYADIRIMKPPLAVKDMYLYMHKKNKELVPLLTDAIRGMKRDGSYGKIAGEALRVNSIKKDKE